MGQLALVTGLAVVAARLRPGGLGPFADVMRPQAGPRLSVRARRERVGLFAAGIRPFAGPPLMPMWTIRAGTVTDGT